MTRHDDTTRLNHMLDYSREAVEMAAGKQREHLDTDRQFSLAITRLVEIIGEAAARVTAEEQQRHPSIPWAEIVGLRNRLIHGYDAVDHDILWEIIRQDLPNLIGALQDLAANS